MHRHYLSQEKRNTKLVLNLGPFKSLSSFKSFIIERNTQIKLRQSIYLQIPLNNKRTLSGWKMYTRHLSQLVFSLTCLIDCVNWMFSLIGWGQVLTATLPCNLSRNNVDFASHGLMFHVLPSLHTTKFHVTWRRSGVYFCNTKLCCARNGSRCNKLSQYATQHCCEKSCT